MSLSKKATRVLAKVRELHASPIRRVATPYESMMIELLLMQAQELKKEADRRQRLNAHPVIDRYQLSHICVPKRI
jgi:hypothetical protein